MSIDYAIDERLEPDEFVMVLRASGLADRRPVDDPACIEGMVHNADLTVTARRDGRLVGVARTVTDFTYAAYLSDLAVDRSLQRRGIGKELMRRTAQQLGPRCTLILLSAPAAEHYYPQVGFEHHPQAWILRPGHEVQ